jgi:HEAT repeat protein
MRLLRPTAIIAALLIIAVSIPPSLFSQSSPKPSRPKQPASRQRQLRRPQRDDALAPAIKQLLETKPLAPQSPDEKASEGNASEDDDKPPADDAPIKKLVAYWSEHAFDSELTPKLSDGVRQRLLEACENRPELLSSLMNWLPENEDTHDRLYKLLNEDPEADEPWKPDLQHWLRSNSSYFRDELIKAALAADDDVHNVREDLFVLANLDWNAAKPILERLASAGKAVVTPIALTLLYEDSIHEGDSARAESYRALLKAIVENRHAIWGARREAMESLMDSEWSGQREWLISLFADPTISGLREDVVEDAAESKDESNARRDATKGATGIDDVTIDNLRLEPEPGIFNRVIISVSDKWLPVVSGLVGHNRRIVHKAAVRCLVTFLIRESGAEKKKESAQKLIPWLTEPNWAAEEDRAEFIRSLTGLNMPELAPGLIWIVGYDEDPDNRAAAAAALTEYRDPRAIPALRRALEREKGEQNREKIVTALAECGGLSDDEMAAAVEAYARTIVDKGGAEKIELSRYSQDPDDPLPLKVSVGRILNDSETIQTTEGLAVRLLERAKALRATEPAVAREILRVIEVAPLSSVDVNLVERIGEGWADVNSVALALECRDAIASSAGNELNRLIKQGGYAAGVAAAILNDEREWKAALESGDAKTQLALLAGARYLRDKLPVELVARMLNSPDRALAKAAESYLEVEDSHEARKIVLSRHPGEMRILGDITAVSDGDSDIETVRRWEDALRKEIRSRNGFEAIYAVAQIVSAADLTGVIVRVRGGKAEMSVYETEGRRNVRLLTDGEFEELKSLTSREEIEDLGPESYFGEDEKGSLKYEYLRLTKESGRRIALDELRRAPKNPTRHEELSGLFYRLSRSGEYTARYNIEEKIPGVEVVFADKRQSVLKVCAEDGEIRALIEGKGAEYRQDSAKAAPEWREFSSGKPGDVRDEPSACRVLNTPSSAPKNATIIRPSLFGQTAQSGGALFYSKYDGDLGIWKVEPEKDPVKIVRGNYNELIITPDGKWLVANKWVTEEGKTAQQLIRRNLQSSEEFVVSLPQNASSPWLRYVAAHDKVLVGFYGNGGSGYLLDPEPGTTQPVKGEFRPLTATLSRAPQSAGSPNLFWAAIYDVEKRTTRFGRYDSKNFVFTPLLEFPELEFSGDDIWVDATSHKIWFAYKGHLLRLPMPGQMK